MVTIQDVRDAIAYFRRPDFAGTATLQERALFISELESIEAKMAERN